MFSLVAPLSYANAVDKDVAHDLGDDVDVVPATLFRGGRWYAAVELMRNGTPLANVADDKPQPSVRLAFTRARQLAELLRPEPATA